MVPYLHYPICFLGVHGDNIIDIYFANIVATLSFKFFRIFCHIVHMHSLEIGASHSHTDPLPL